MLTEGQQIRNYMRDVIKDDEAFILLELKADANKKDFKSYNYYCKGESRTVLMAIAEIVEREAKQMGLTFDQTVEVMKNMHGINEGHYRTRSLERIARDWKVIE